MSSQWDAGNEALPTTHCAAHVPFYWFQNLPAGATIDVEHRYRPMPGYSFVTCEALDEDYVKRGFCVNEGFRRKFVARVKAEKNQSPIECQLSDSAK